MQTSRLVTGFLRLVSEIIKGAFWIVVWIAPLGVALFAFTSSPNLVASVYILSTLPFVILFMCGGLSRRRVRSLTRVTGPDLASLIVGSITFAFGVQDKAEENLSPLLLVCISFWLFVVGGILLACRQEIIDFIPGARRETRQLGKLVVLLVLQILLWPMRNNSYLTATYLAAAGILLILPNDWPNFSLAACIYVFVFVARGWDYFRAKLQHRSQRA